MRHPARPHTRNGGVPTRRVPPRWAWRLLWPEWRQELLALALIIMTVAAGWLLASR